MKVKVIITTVVLIFLFLCILAYTFIEFTNGYRISSINKYPYSNINLSDHTFKRFHDLKIALIDMGINKSESPCLSKLKIYNSNINNKDDADNNHGTLIASSICVNKILSSIDNRGSSLLDHIEIINYDIGTDEKISIDSLVKAVQSAIQENVDIINLSLGTYKDDSNLRKTIEEAIRKGILIISATGNDMTRQKIYPAAYPNVVAVSAYDPNNVYLNTNNVGSYITVSAPGKDISTGVVNNQVLSGNSVACTFVTALSSLLKSQNPKLNNESLIQNLKKTSRDLGVRGKDQYYGFGSIDVRKAIMYQQNKLYYKIGEYIGGS